MEQFDAYIKQIEGLQRKITELETANTVRKKNRSVYLPDLREDKELANRVSEHHGWCDIQELSGELEEGIFLATFADDFKQIFEYDGTYLRMMFTEDQEKIWDEELTDEERTSTLEEIAYFFMATKESSEISKQE